jgi:hypothetical protein
MIQRRLRIGYNRAARIMDIMEDKGIVGPENGSSRAKSSWTSTPTATGTSPDAAVRHRRLPGISLFPCPAKSLTDCTPCRTSANA